MRRIERIYEGGLLVKEISEEMVDDLLVKQAVIDSGGDADALMTLIKSNEEQRVTIGVAYPANKPDVNVAADGHIDFASKEVVEKTAHRWLKERQEIGLYHRAGTEGHGVVVESGIHRGPDWIEKAPDGSTHIVSDGDWVLGVEWDRPTWNLVKAGLINGYSPQGGGTRRTPSDEALAGLRSA
jgi:hypothetical protein